MRKEVDNDGMSPRRAMTLQAGRGRAPAAEPAPGPAPRGEPAPRPPPSMPYFIENFTLIRLYLQSLRVISHLYQNTNARLPRMSGNFNFSTRPLVKLKASVNDLFSNRTRTVCGFKSLIVKAIVQLFVVAKCILCGARCLIGQRRGSEKRARLLLLLWLSGFGSYSEGRRDEDLHIGGIFPMEGEGGWQGGQACKPAAELALADVNARSDLLSGFKLLLHSNDSKVIYDLHSLFIDPSLLTAKIVRMLMRQDLLPIKMISRLQGIHIGTYQTVSYLRKSFSTLK